MKQWVRRATALHDELAAIADIRDPRWWLLAGGAALEWGQRGTYVASDAAPWADTFIGYEEPAPRDVLADAFARAHAARAALRDLDGELPDQPLAVTVKRSAQGAITVPSALDVVAFAIGDRVIAHRLARTIEEETGAFVPADAVPFATITLGDEPIETARHGHRRAWTDSGGASGPWLGLGRATPRPRSAGAGLVGSAAPWHRADGAALSGSAAPWHRADGAALSGSAAPWHRADGAGLVGTAGGLAIVSTCHMVVDGYGHAWLTARIAEYTASMRRAVRPMPALAIAAPSPVADAIALEVAWRPLASPAPRAIEIAYALGQVLHRLAGKPDALFSPTFQIPVAPGELGDPLRMRRRVVPAIASVRFERGTPEPFASFANRTKNMLAREAAGDGLASRLLGAARALPMPLAWKRNAVGPERPGWLEPIADLVGGRGCVSRIKLGMPMPPSCAVSSPSRLASDGDELGSCVVTIVDDGERAAITWCGSGTAGSPRLLDDLLALAPA